MAGEAYPTTGHLGRPQVKALIKFDTLAGFVPSDADADFHVAALAGPTGQFMGNYNGVKFDQEAECFYREPIYANRNNYVFQKGVTETEKGIYLDSDAKLEQGRRTWIPILRLGQVPGRTGDNAFLSTADFAQNETSYPSEYNGPRWGLIKMPASNVKGSSGVVPEAQWIHQMKAGSGVTWAVRQEKPNYKNQPFWVSFKKGYALNPSQDSTTIPEGSTAIKDVFDPAYGSWLMIVLGALGGARNLYNSYSIVFPIDASPFILDNNVWYKNLARLKLNTSSTVDSEKLGEALSSAVLANNTSPDWILKNDMSDFDLEFMVIRNRLFIRSSFASASWVFPDKLTENMETGGHVKSDLLAADKSTSFSEGFSIPNVPIEIHGKGFTCAINFNPMEFQQGPAFISFPPINYSDSSTSSDYDGKPAVQVLTPWYSDKPVTKSNIGSGLTEKDVDESPFCIPSGDPDIKSYGFDYHPYHKITTMGLGPDCIDWRVEPGFPKNLYGAEIEIAPGVKEIGTSPTSKLMTVTRIRVAFIPNKKGKGSDGYDVVSSAAYRTPFLFRIKFKVRTNYINSDPGVDISKHILSVTHSTTQQNKTLINREISLTLLMPKQNDPDYDKYPIKDRKSLKGLTWMKLERNPALIRIWLGQTGSRNVPEELKADLNDPKDCYFTGITDKRSMEMSSQRDQCSITCVEFMSLLDYMYYTSSPFFDGMSLPYAIAHVLERAGFSALSSIPSGFAYQITDDALAVRALSMNLPDSGRFTQPLMKFNSGTTLMNIIKQFVERFQMVFRCSPTGTFLLDTVPGAIDIVNNPSQDNEDNASGDIRFMPTNDLPVKDEFKFTSFPNEDNIHNTLLSKKVLSLKNSSWHNVISILVEDRFTGAVHAVQDGDPDSILNPEVENFLGYMRVYFSKKSALGGKAEAVNLIEKQKKIMMRPVVICSVTMMGRKDLKPLDLIKIDNNNYRVLEIRGQMQAQPVPKWTMEVTGECTGYFNDEIDTSELIYNDD
jgi:hypothetical protein